MDKERKAMKAIAIAMVMLDGYTLKETDDITYAYRRSDDKKWTEVTETITRHDLEMANYAANLLMNKMGKNN